MNLTVLVQTGGGQTFSSNGIKLSELKDKNKLLFDYFSAKGVEYVYSSDIQKLKEEFDDGDGKFSKKELKKMGLDIKRSDVKAVNHTLNEIAATELADDGSYPVKINENRTEVYSKDKQLKFALELEGDNKVNYFDKDGNKTRSVEQNGNNTTTTYFSSGKPKTIIEEQKDFGVTTTEIVYNDNGTSNRVITYSGEKLLGKNGNITKEDITETPEGISKVVTQNGQQKIYDYDAAKGWVEAKPVETDPKKEEIPKTEFKEVFEKSGKKATIDETGSTQRLTRNNTWTTDVVIPKRANYDGNGIPKEIAIALAGDYGQKGADGAAQKRYQSLKLIDAENNVYADKAGIRHFQMNISDDGITLKQVSYNNGQISQLGTKDSMKIKDFLDKNVKTAEDKAVEKAQKDTGRTSPGADDKLSHTKTKMGIKSYEDAKDVIGLLKDRNLAWGAYTSIGTDNGSLTGDLGLIEHLMDTSFIDKDGKSHKLTYDDLKPAIQGLMSRVPENMKNDPDYRMAETLIRNAEAGKPLSAKPLDISFIALAKKMQLQGTNFMPNQFLRGSAGNVMITPDYSNSMWESDAKFNLPTTDNAGKPVNKDFYFYRDDTLYDKCYDFQDIVGEGGLITNNSTGNNRKGEINFEAQKLDANETYYFQTKGGEKIEVKVQDGKAYVQDKNGKNILLNDILNGRVKMP